MARFPGFVGPAYTSQSKIAAADELLNLYPEPIESGTGKAPVVLYSVPGYRQWCDLGVSHPIRGQFALNGAGYVVAGGALYLLPSTRGGSATQIVTGMSNPDDSLVSIAGNGDGGYQLVIASAGRLYNVDLRTNTLTEITGLNASFVTFLDGTFYALDPSTSNLYASGVEDGSSWDAIDVAQRSDQPDKWLALLAHTGQGQIWLPGSKTGSIYYDSGDVDFPLSPNQSKLSSGILAPRSAVMVGSDPMWLAQDAAGGAIVVRGQGYQLQRVSTHAIEYALSTYSTLQDADAFSYQEKGHLFYCLNFPTANASWCFDATTNLWHRRWAWDGNTAAILPLRTHAYAFGAHLVGDRSTGIVWEQRGDVYTGTDGNGLLRLRRAPHLSDENVRIIYDSLTLDMEVGVGLASGQGSDPQMMLRWSDDGGQSFGNVETASIGATGVYTTRVQWWMLGQARDRVFEVSCSEPIPLALIDCYLALRRGRS